MKIKLLIYVFIFSAFTLSEVFAQVYSPVLNYSFNGTPTNGIKIKTNIPFQHGLGMPTIIIEGYNYGQRKPIGLTINWYVYNNNFVGEKISSFGAYTPEIKLANENGYIIIFVNDQQYYNRFTVRAFAKGKSESGSMFENWTVSDESIFGTNISTIPYQNEFAGKINFPNGIWDNSGNVGIGTTNPTERLVVNGKIKAEEVIVEENVGADFVFEDDYVLPKLSEVETYIRLNKHLPDISSAEEMIQNGIKVGELQIKLLRKIEELTLYLIQLKNENNKLRKRVSIIEESK